MRKLLCLWLCAALMIPAGCGRVQTVTYALRAEPTAIEAYAIHGFGDGIVTVWTAAGDALTDADGHLIDTAGQFATISGFENGRAMAQRENDLQWIYINTQIQEIEEINEYRETPSKFIYDASETTGEKSANGDYLFGIKSSDGEYITEPMFEWIASVENEYNFARLAEGERRNVMISPRGEVLVTLPDGDLRAAYRSGEQFICRRGDDAYILTDLQGRTLNDTSFSAIGNISEGLRVVMVEDKLGLLDERGKTVLAPSLTIDPPYDYTPHIWQDRIACIKDGRLMMVAIEAYSADGTRLPMGLHDDVSPADLTDDQAQDILDVLVPKQIEIEMLFSGEGAVDYTQPCPINKDYYLSTDTRFSCVQDIKDYISATVTVKVAQVYFDTHLDSAHDAPLGMNEYIDYDSRLYRNTASGGVGFATAYLVDTARIVRRTDDAVEIEMDTLIFGESNSLVYTPTLVKTADGWRIDNDIDKGYDISP